MKSQNNLDRRGPQEAPGLHLTRAQISFSDLCFQTPAGLHWEYMLILAAPKAAAILHLPDCQKKNSPMS